MPTVKRIVALLLKWLNKEKLAKDEKEDLRYWIDRSPHNRQLVSELKDEEAFEAEIKKVMRYDAAALWKNVLRKRAEEKKRRESTFRSWLMQNVAVVAFFLMLLLGYYIFLFAPLSLPTKPSSLPIVEKPVPIDTFARSNALMHLSNHNPLWTISDDQRSMNVILGNSKAGFPVEDDGVVISKTKDGLKYKGQSRKHALSRVSFHKVTTLRGASPFEVSLSDGTTVWLNAASSIQYPPTFSGTSRIVKITGEACFEVSEDSLRPFIVIVSGRNDTIKTNSSYFNVNAYAEEPHIKTTSLDEIASMDPRDAMWDKNVAKEIKEVTSWRYGMITFINNDIPTVIRRLNRLYDVDIVYSDKVGEKRQMLTGQLKREMSINEIVESFNRFDIGEFTIVNK